jgi:U3 small nucleolar RNA-associated protein 20
MWSDSQMFCYISNFPIVHVTQELNTAEDFISFYDEMIPLVQTLPQIVLHREKIFAALLQRVNMAARLSLEPILM